MDTTKKTFLCIIVLLLLPVILNAQESQESKEKDYEIALTKGQYEIELGNYNAAIQYITQALTLKPRDQAANLSLGIAYSRSGDNGRARDVLQQAANDNPGDTRAQYELALVLGKLGQAEESKRVMAAVARSNDPELSGAARGFLEGTGAGAGEKKFIAKLAGGLQYDSNVILEQDSPTTSGVKNSDWRWVWAVNGSYAFLDTNRANAEVGYQFYKSIHDELKDYNVQQHIGRLAGKYALSKTMSADMEYDLIYTSLRGDHYSTAHRFMPRLSTNLTPESLTELHATYEAKRFFTTPVFTGLTEKNGSNTSAGVSHTVMLSKTAAISVDYTYDKDSATASSWSYTGNKGTMNALSELGHYRIMLSASYYDRKYQGLIPGAPETRHDGAQEYSACVTRKAGKDLSVTLSETYTRNDSNLEIYQYTRSITGLTLELSL